MTISYLVGDATEPASGGVNVIAHVCNDSGGWGAGFTSAISKKWIRPVACYRRWHREGPDFELGKVQVVDVDLGVFVANMLAQHGYASKANPVALDYDALGNCLEFLSWRFQPTTVINMPRIGCGLAGGSWDRVEPLLLQHLGKHDVRVYDLPGQKEVSEIT